MDARELRRARREAVIELLLRWQRGEDTWENTRYWMGLSATEYQHIYLRVALYTPAADVRRIVAEVL